MRRRSFWVVVLARLLPAVRTLVSTAAGAAGVRYARFAVADTVAALVWAGVWVFGGAVVARTLLGPMSGVAVAAAVIATLVVVGVRRRVAVR